MNHYEELGIEMKAAPEEIKRAYFRMTRQFTPEKNPERFMRIREAYELLSDVKSRKEYDAELSSFSEIPSKTAQTIMEAKRLFKKGLRSDAIGLLERENAHPRPIGRRAATARLAADAVSAALCQLYVEAGSSGKAVKLAEKLVEDNPENAEYLRLAVAAYQARGWHNKARQYKFRLERLAPGNEDNTLALVSETWNTLPPEMLGEMVETIERQGGKAPLLSTYAFVNHLMVERVLSPLRLMLDDEPHSWNNLLFAAEKWAEHTEGIPPEKAESILDAEMPLVLQILYNLDIYNLMPYIDRVIQNIGAGEQLLSSVKYRCIRVGYDAQEAVRAGIPKKLAALSLLNVWSRSENVNETVDEEDRKDYLQEIVALEFDILASYRHYKAHIQRLREEFGNLYQYAADFLDITQRCTENKRRIEIEKRIPNLLRLRSRLTLSWLGPDDEFEEDQNAPQKPVRVTKVGRNELCPCGSGKKYKKCCGQ